MAQHFANLVIIQRGANGEENEFYMSIGLDKYIARRARALAKQHGFYIPDDPIVEIEIHDIGVAWTDEPDEVFES